MFFYIPIFPNGCQDLIFSMCASQYTLEGNSVQRWQILCWMTKTSLPWGSSYCSEKGTHKALIQTEWNKNNQGGCKEDSTIWDVPWREKVTFFPKGNEGERKNRQRAVHEERHVHRIVCASKFQLVFVLETLNVRRMEKAANLGRQEQIMKHQNEWSWIDETTRNLKSNAILKGARDSSSSQWPQSIASSSFFKRGQMHAFMCKCPI